MSGWLEYSSHTYHEIKFFYKKGLTEMVKKPYIIVC